MPGKSARRRVVGYIRVSTEEQAEHGASLGAQEARLRAYATAMDLELVSIERDEGLSAKSLARPGLQRALARLEAGEADGILLVKLDRLTRSLRDLLDLVDRYFRDRFALLSMSDSIDTSNANGRLLLWLLGVIAQWEREIIAERTKDALTHLRATGGGTPRVEGPALERILELAREKLSNAAIAARLTAEGIPTRKGGTWAKETVRKVLARAAA